MINRVNLDRLEKQLQVFESLARLLTHGCKIDPRIRLHRLKLQRALD